MKQTIFLLTLFMLLLLQSQAGLAQASGDEAQIRETLTHYIEGRNGGDLERLKKAFHPSAALKFVDPESGGLGEWSLEQYLTRLKPGQQLNCTGSIIDIRIFSDAAQATVQLTYPNLLFYDYMSLLKVDGRWLIVDKTFARKQLEKPSVVGGYGSPTGKAFNPYGHLPAEVHCEICTRQEYRDKSEPCPHNL